MSKKQEVKKVDNDVWFNLDKVLSYNALLNFIVGARGCGKTYGVKKWCVKNFIKKGHKFIYLRRIKDEIKGQDLLKFFDDIREDPELKGHVLKVMGTQFYCDGLVCGEAVNLSVQQSKKSVSYQDVYTIMYDEFIIEKGYQKYLPNEVIHLYNFMDTVFRHREGCRCICLANSVRWSNPYFIFFKFVPMHTGIQVAKEGTVLLYIYTNEKYKEMRKESKFAKMIKDTMYEELAIENKFADMNLDFIKKRPPKGILEFNIKWKDKIYGLWYDPKEGCYIICYAYNNDVTTVCYTTADYKPNMQLICNRTNRFNKEIIKAIKMGYLYYEDIYIRNEIYDLATLLGVK